MLSRTTHPLNITDFTLGSDDSRLRADQMDSDLLLTEQLTVRRRHGSLFFVLAVQLFIDEAVISW